MTTPQKNESVTKFAGTKLNLDPKTIIQVIRTQVRPEFRPHLVNHHCKTTYVTTTLKDSEKSWEVLTSLPRLRNQSHRSRIYRGLID